MEDQGHRKDQGESSNRMFAFSILMILIVVLFALILNQQIEKNMNTFRTSKGETITKAKIDRNVRKAKEIKLRQFKNDHGYFFCEACNHSFGRIDCSHTISVNECQNLGRAELAWDIKNIRLLCRLCHNKLDSKPSYERK